MDLDCTVQRIDGKDHAVCTVDENYTYDKKEAWQTARDASAGEYIDVGVDWVSVHIGVRDGKSFTGVHLGIWNNYDEEIFTGVEVGVVNATDVVNGVQLSLLANIVETLKGVQVSLLTNGGKDIAGVQISSFENACKTLTGVQFGMMNARPLGLLFGVGNESECHEITMENLP